MSKNYFAPGEYYHCYSRGTDKRTVFLNKKDYDRFTALLFVCNSRNPIQLSNLWRKSYIDIFKIVREKTLVDIGAYCLMPNHFHILLKEKEVGGISLFMQKLITSYTMYFNKKNNRTGALFGSTYKSEHIDNDRYLKYLFSYIHLNPVKLIDLKWKENGIKNIKKTRGFLKNFWSSSYLDYLGVDRHEAIILNKMAFPEYFNNKKEFETEIFDWLNRVKV